MKYIQFFSLTLSALLTTLAVYLTIDCMLNPPLGYPPMGLLGYFLLPKLAIQFFILLICMTKINVEIAIAFIACLLGTSSTCSQDYNNAYFCFILFIISIILQILGINKILKTKERN